MDLKIYSPDDESMLYYLSDIKHDLPSKIVSSCNVKSYIKFTNDNEEIVNQLDGSITSHNGRNGQNNANTFLQQLEQ